MEEVPFLSGSQEGDCLDTTIKESTADKAVRRLKLRLTVSLILNVVLLTFCMLLLILRPPLPKWGEYINDEYGNYACPVAIENLQTGAASQ
jgi:hypothetical protein